MPDELSIKSYISQMKNLSILAVLTAVTSLLLLSTLHTHSNTGIQFRNWKRRFGLQYASHVEDYYRRRVFQSNLEHILSHNGVAGQSYRMGVNQFTGLTDQEFQHLYLAPLDVEASKTGRKVELTKAVMDDDVDWVEKGAVTPIKNVGTCSNGNWAFSAVGALEGINQISTGTLSVFSEQQLIDCTNAFCSCDGGFTDMGFRYVEGKGLCEEKDYPFAGTKQSCKATQCSFKIMGYDFVDNCDGLSKAITQQPISVAVDAANWKSYESGVFTNCGIKMNAMALLVGVVGGNWKIKNSWGVSWGEQGYIRLAPGNTCGICSIGLYPIK